MSVFDEIRPEWDAMKISILTLIEEDAKLRELIRDLYECLEHSRPFCKNCKFQENNCQWFKFITRMSELGIEVAE